MRRVQMIQPMTPRDEFAMAALNGMLAADSDLGMNPQLHMGKKEAATQAYAFADAMMAEREKPWAKKGEK